MALYVIGDLHLSFGVKKPMDIFKGWENHVEKLTRNWNNVVSDGDTVVVAGDISWGIDFDEAKPDFKYLNDTLNGSKIVLKGNHDYWWSTMAKLQAFKQSCELERINFLFNNSYVVDGVSLCGTRGWTMDGSDVDEAKITAREAGRMERSLESAKTDKIIAFLHYPPVFLSFRSPEIIDALKRHNVESCYYGHLHGDAIPCAANRTIDGIAYKNISADAVNFCPYRIF